MVRTCWRWGKVELEWTVVVVRVQKKRKQKEQGNIKLFSYNKFSLCPVSVSSEKVAAQIFFLKLVTYCKISNIYLSQSLCNFEVFFIHSKTSTFKNYRLINFLSRISM